ncbi:hypothetical protein K493DRAFT_354896 [Basidiobolus meristosporus CBS 931.73]|uniref:Potassium channel tetramerisation-type BTB domain-containing protein n=1 Tax=Basidiobolus meristosporus CBS 931.73 TaxID=1314790 RepID=A0A1Y1Y2A1_9FUNG|nr:hypothetical protein K493DRAFT_354896 [Basidiobolus meristosporus CBS 931.73]|eukprot:ORX92099.1 hypothetical protein K493DRAFT_354896 [Basidiobolus meristosporus CBS 931.73]
MTFTETRPSDTKESPIILNIGGEKFVTTLGTLRSQPDTMLGRMFAEHNQSITKPNDDGEYFIDYSPEWFDRILEFHRTGKPLHRPKNANSFDQIINFWAVPSQSVAEELNSQASLVLKQFLDVVVEIMFQAVGLFSSNVCIVLNRGGAHKVWLGSVDHEMEEKTMSQLNHGYQIIRSPAKEIVIRYLEKTFGASVCVVSNGKHVYSIKISNYLNYEEISRNIFDSLE